MIKVGIEFTTLDAESHLNVAQDLQRFIVEDEYAIGTIVQKLQEKKMVVLDVSNEKNMPDLTTVLEAFDEDEVEYKLFKVKNNDWDLCELSDLNLDRNSEWLLALMGIAIVGYLGCSFFEIFAIYDLYSIKYEHNGIFAAIGATVTAFIPLVGSVFAYLGATELWHWGTYITLFLYFWYYLPIIGFLFYLMGMTLGILYKERWYDFWYPKFKR